MLKNTTKSWGLISKTLHWVIAGLFIYLFYLAITMTGMENGAEKWKLYAEHKQFGVLVGILVLFRILWKVMSKSPDIPYGTEKWKENLAKITHFILYAIMIGFPLSGYLMSMSGGHGIEFFGYSLPNFVGENKELGNIAHSIHSILEYVTYIVVGLHVVGALYHHFVEKDNILKRMLPFGK